MFDSILTPRVLAIIGIIGLALFAFSFAWAFFKVSYQRAIGRPLPRNWFTNGCDVIAEVGANLPGALNRALKLAGKPGLFLPTQPADGSAPTASAATIDVLSTENASLRDALAAYQRRVGESHAVTAPGVAHPAQMFAPVFDPTARQTIVPEVAAQIASETLPRDGQRGSISLRALLVVALLSLVALAASCIPARRFVLDHTDGVPSRVACTPRTQACSITDAGVYLPVVYSDECRPWPTLSLRADGTQRTCAPGEGCAVDGDSGIASCTAADGGGL